VIAHNTEQHLGSPVPPKNRILPPGGNLPHLGNHWVKTFKREKNSTGNRTNRIFQ